jgi:hypothetical protein
VADEEEKLQDPEEPQGPRLMTVLYSQHRDLYKLPALGKDFWMSVERRLVINQVMAPGTAKSADGTARRRVYHNWSSIVPGITVALPETDALVADYVAYAATEESQ